MEYKYILYEEKEENIGLLTFNRPKALNALSPDLLQEVDDLLSNLEKEKKIKVLILTGAGEKAFIAGADISVMKDFDPLGAKRFAMLGQGVLFKIEEASFIVIAAVNGYALGGGCEVAMACDIIYAAESAKFGQPEINLGVIPGFGGTQRLSRLVGRNIAKELCLTGDMIGAGEAKEIGLVNKIFPKEDLMEETMKTARKIAGKGRVAIREIKQVINNGIQIDLRDGCALEADGFALCFASPDQKEGMEAFLEKRKPVFKGGL